MRIQTQDKAVRESLSRGAKTMRPVGRVGRSTRLRLPWSSCLSAASYVLMAALCGGMAYLWRAPLPLLPAPEVADGDLAVSSAPGRAGSRASLEACLRQVKVRELFKPSIPVPSEDRLGKTTAQELADRLQFLGIAVDPGGLAALVFIPNRGPGTFRVGDRVAEFVLKEVRTDRLILELGDEQAILKR